MADIKFTGFVNQALTSAEGEVWLLKTAESHRRENAETGEWETTARTFRDVRLSNDAAANIDLSAFAAEGTRIVVEGFEVTIHTERDGQDYYNLNVYASSIELAESAQPQPKAKAPAARKPAPARAGASARR